MNNIRQPINRALCLVLFALVCRVSPALAASATWLASPVSGNWSDDANWNGLHPMFPSDTATFATSTITSIFFSASRTDVDSIMFNSGASAFTIALSNQQSLFIQGAGIINNSGSIQNFVADSNSVIRFNNGTAGSSTAFTANGATVSSPFGGVTVFYATSSAGSATFTTNGGAVINSGNGYTEFFDNSTAANGSFTTNGGLASGASGGETSFNSSATAANATLVTNGGAVTDASGGVTSFNMSATAANATLVTNGGAVTGAFGGVTVFFVSSTAGNANLIANGDPNAGEGGLIDFRGSSTGGTARVQVYGTGQIAVDRHSNGGVTIGSLEGTGGVSLGANNLTIGSNNLSTTFSGVIQDGGSVGSMTKIGSGTLTLSGANTYTGATAVNAGTLLANNSSGSATGFGAVTVSNSGTVLGGTGTITGPVTVDAGARLQGGDGTTGTTLTLGGALTLSDNSVIQLALGPGGTHSTLARTGSGTWTFDSNQAFTFLDLGAQVGTYSNIITGLASDPGTGWMITNAGWTGMFTYNGGNISLDVTAVPEPSTWIGGALVVGLLGWSQRRRFLRLCLGRIGHS